jgi:hypothetical protein
MRKIVFIFILICSVTFYFSSCLYVNIHDGTWKKIVGNGVLKEQERNKMDFNALDTRGSISVYISESSDMPVTVSGDENLIDYIETCVKDEVLHVHFKNGYGYSSKKNLKVTIPNNGKLKNIHASASSNVYIKGRLVSDNMSITIRGSADLKGDIKADNIKMDCSGSSDFKGHIEAKTLVVNCSGSSDCIISGSADVCNLSMSGSSDFKGYDFIAKKCDGSASGSSDIWITCTEELSVRTSGSSDVYYRGHAKVTSARLFGSSNLHWGLDAPNK